MIRKSTHTFPQRRDLVAVDNNLGSGATGSSSSLLGNMRQRRVVSLDSIDSRDQDQSNSNAKKRSHSAGNPGGACGSVMHPLLFEEVDLGNTPLSSLRSCSEFQKMNSNSSWRGRMDEQANNKKSSMSAYIFSFFKMSKKGSSLSEGSGGSTKKTLRGAGNDERSFFVESMTKRDEPVAISKPFSAARRSEGFSTSFSSSSSSSARPRASMTAYAYPSDISNLRHSHPHRKSSIEESHREASDPLVGGRRDRGGYSRSGSFYYESSTALDMLFGLRSDYSKPMEIELKTMKKIGGEYVYTGGQVSTAYEEAGSFVVDSGDVSPSSMPPSPFRGDIPRSSLISLTQASDRSSPLVSYFPAHAQLCQPCTPLEAFRWTDVHSWRPAACHIAEIIPEKCRKWVSGAGDDVLYEQLRIQPFGFGAYLRGMLWAGFSSLFFNAYSLALWPSLKDLSPASHTLSCIFYSYLFVQFVFNVVQIPFRVLLHLKCWESSRTVDVEASLVVLRLMIQSDIWVINRALGRCQDVLSAVFLLAGELYLRNSTASDPLHPIVVSICASTLLAMVIRVGIALVFSLSCHDPQILLEARRRGLSRLDIEVLPTFVFTSLEEVNNESCSICLCDFEMGEMLIALPCGKKHSFHGGCIRQWLQRQNSCPLCQKMV